MAISIGSGFALHKKAVLDDRTLFDTVKDMKDYSENFLGDMGYAFVKENGKMYIFNRDNEVSDTTGKWRLLEGGEGSSELESSITANSPIGFIPEGKTFEAGTSLEDVLRLLIEGEPIAEDDFYYGAFDSRDIVSLYQFTGATSASCTITANNQYIAFATKEEKGNIEIRDENGFGYNSDFDKITIVHNGINYNVYVGKYRITTTGFNYKLSFKE